jgi:hypothetical protein
VEIVNEHHLIWCREGKPVSWAQCRMTLVAEDEKNDGHGRQRQVPIESGSYARALRQHHNYASASQYWSIVKLHHPKQCLVDG